MWTTKLFETDLYHLVAAFILYSMLGWLVESIYMSICNRKLTNRGFAKVPFCPIYGFGAVIGYLMLYPLSDNMFLLYFAGAFAATIFEFLVGKLMIKMFGELWWDYNKKPFNYKGIICLESTVAWGFYAVIIIGYLHNKVLNVIDSYDRPLGIQACKAILFIVFIDYVLRFKNIYGITFQSQKEWMNEKYQTVRDRIQEYYR